MSHVLMKNQIQKLSGSKDVSLAQSSPIRKGIPRFNSPPHVQPGEDTDDYTSDPLSPDHPNVRRDLPSSSPGARGLLAGLGSCKYGHTEA